MRIALGFLLFLLAGCASNAPQDSFFEPTNIAANVPTIVKAIEPLIIKGTVDIQGCSTFERLEVQRTAQTLSLRIVVRQPVFVACPPVAVPPTPFEYTDAPNPRRSNPFAVVINGQSYAVVVGQ